MMVSIIVPVYNAENYLTDCIDAIVNQSYRNFELILVNDGSSDRSGEICDGYAEKDPRIRVIHKANAGVSAARNSGLKMASGEYIAFCDCDDQYDPNFLSEMIGTANEIGADIVVCNYCYKNGASCKDPFAGGTSGWVSKETLYSKIFLSNEIGGFVWNKLFRRSILTGISFPEDMTICEDTYFLTAAVMNAHGIYYLRKTLYYYNMRENSAVSQITNLISSENTSKYTDAYKRIMRDFQLSDAIIHYAHCGIYRLAVHVKCDYQIAKGKNQSFLSSLNRDIKENQKHFIREPSLSAKTKIRTLANSRFNLRRFKGRRFS